MGYLIDTCIWIDVERGILSAADVARFTGSEPVFISPVTLAELVIGVEMAQQPAIRQQRLAAMERLRKKPFVGIDELTGLIFGRLAAELRRKGRQHKQRVNDLWLAAQAVQRGLTLLTRNGRDFADIPGLELQVI